MFTVLASMARVIWFKYGNIMMKSETLLKYAPRSVFDVLREIKLESSVMSIWLIGSRANQNSNLKSDWDLLVFSSIEPAVVPRRRSNIDVIRIGPSGQGLLEGMDLELIFCFDDWRWIKRDNQIASYVEKKFTAQERVVHDTNEPIMRRCERLAYLIWSRKSQVSGYSKLNR
jgi:hypothetical protein